VLGSPRTLLRLGAEDFNATTSNRARVGGWLVDRRPIVWIEYSTRSGGNQWRFDLGAPCE
jgi:hypothetical protein